MEGTCLNDYSTSWRSWNTHTDTTEFAARFEALIEREHHDINRLNACVEQFLLQEAINAGVVQQVQWEAPRNPNKVGKQLAPWFTEACKEARQRYKQAARDFGRSSETACTSFREYKRQCLAAKERFAATLPDQLKY